MARSIDQIQSMEEEELFYTFEKIPLVIKTVELGSSSFLTDGKIQFFVNPTNRRLDGRGQISQILRQKCGKKYIDECVQLSKRRSRKTCEVTSAGDLKDMKVIHLFYPSMQEFQDKSIKEKYDLIFTAINESLETAEEKRQQGKPTAIALPFLFSGNYGMSVEECGLQYAYAILEFSRGIQSTYHIDTIYFIDNSKDTTRALVEIFEEVFPRKFTQLLVVPKQFNDDPTTDSASSEADYSQVNRRKTVSNATEETRDDAAKETSQVPGRRSTAISQEVIYNRECHENAENSGNSKLRDDPYVYARTSIKSYVHARQRFKVTDKLFIEVIQSDIRTANQDVIICPEVPGKRFGGFLSVAMKARYRPYFLQEKLKKLSGKNERVASTICTEPGTGPKYLYHVSSPVYTEEESTIRSTISVIFKKLTKHRSRNIRSIAIPLLGIEYFDKLEVVQECCRIQVTAVFELCREHAKRISPLTIVFVNKCETVTKILRGLCDEIERQ